MMNDFTTLSGALLESERFIITGHIMPDGDCLGSVLGLGMALRNMGKKVLTCSPDRSPAIYEFLPGGDRLVYSLTSEMEEDYDVLIALDCSTEDRLGKLKYLLDQPGKKVVNIDHHIDNSNFGDYIYVDSTAAATGEIIYNLLEFMNLEVTREIATCLYTALMTDTDSFKYSNTTPKTLRLAADLMDLGASAYDISNRIYGEKPLGNLKALEVALRNLKISSCGRVAWMLIDSKTHQELGVSHEHTDGLVKKARNLRGIEVALLFREVEPGKVKISLRSKFKVNVSTLASQFGGGGHPRAAGCVVNGNLDNIVNDVVDTAVKAVKLGDRSNEGDN